MVKIFYEDSDILVVEKPPGLDSQTGRGFDPDMVSEIKNYLRLSTGMSTKTAGKGGEPYVGVIHRLDKPVSGILVYAKEKKAAAVLSSQLSDGTMKKQYLAVACGKVDKNVDNFVDYLLKDGKNNVSRIVDMGISGAKKAELECRGLKCLQMEPYGVLTLTEITLKTGRHHQIRVQMAGHGFPLFGDRKYNPDFQTAGKGMEHIALSAYRLSFLHPTTQKAMEYCRMPDGEVFRKFDKI